MGKWLHIFGKSLAVAWLFGFCATAQTAADVPSTAALRPALQAMGTVTQFHRMAMGEPEVAAEMYCEDRCFRRWKQRMAALKKAQWVDFFVGAMEITGSYDKENAVSAIYNPFWDTILLLELKLPEMGGKAAITKFAMLAGETFRGEKPGKYPFLTVVSKRPLFVELATVFTKTAEHFDKTFPQKTPPSLGEFAFSNLEDELKLISLRSAMRLKQTKDLLANNEDAKMMKALQIILQHGRRNDFRKLFWDGRHDAHIRTILSFPEDVREQFILYSYYKKPNATVFTYVPLFMPRLVATVTIPKEDSDGPVKENSPAPTFEIYDLNDSESVLKLYNMAKGGDGK